MAFVAFLVTHMFDNNTHQAGCDKKDLPVL